MSRNGHSGQRNSLSSFLSVLLEHHATVEKDLAERIREHGVREPLVSSLDDYPLFAVSTPWMGAVLMLKSFGLDDLLEPEAGYEFDREPDTELREYVAKWRLEKRLDMHQFLVGDPIQRWAIQLDNDGRTDDFLSQMRAKYGGTPFQKLVDDAASAAIETTAAEEKPKKRKRSTERGEGRAKLIAALTKHHKYADSSCLNLEPIGNNELARLAVVDQATASVFFKQQFKGHGKYKAGCADAGRLAAALKLLNGEFAPHLLYGSKPADEDERDEE